MELQRANSELERSLEENARMRGYLARVVENLPCGVLVAGADGVQLINPEARHLLQVPVEWSPESSRRLPPTFEAVLAGFPANSFFCEQESSIGEGSANRTIGILRANISEQADAKGDTIWIVRDITEQKRLGEREAARRSLALAEIATVLAHEIHNPLGSMELFTGTLADATTHLPETRQWITPAGGSTNPFGNHDQRCRRVYQLPAAQGGHRLRAGADPHHSWRRLPDRRNRGTLGGGRVTRGCRLIQFLKCTGNEQHAV